MRSGEVLCAAKLLRKWRMFVLYQVFFMHAPTPISFPSRSRAIVLWLTAIILGAILIVLYTVVALKKPTNGRAWLPVGPLLLISSLAAIFSLPAFVFLPVTAKVWWAVSSRHLVQRHLRLLLVMGSLFGAAALFAYCAFGFVVWIFSGTGRGWQIAAVFWVAAPYFPALLLSAYLLYAKWLFGPAEPLT